MNGNNIWIYESQVQRMVAEGHQVANHTYNHPCLLYTSNLSVRSGETIGIIGGTGSAKTSLVSLISRLYDVTAGQVLVGGRDVREYDLESLRDQVSVVLQKNVLFSRMVPEKRTFFWSTKMCIRDRYSAQMRAWACLLRVWSSAAVRQSQTATFTEPMARVGP